MLRSFYLVVALAPTVFGTSSCDSQLDGAYDIALQGAAIGSGTICGSDMTMDFGAGGEASGTFTTSNGEGTAILVGTGTLGLPATGTHIGAYTWNSDCSELGIVALGQTLVLTRQPDSTPPTCTPTGEDPCFPSSATVTLADGTSSRIDALKEGDTILAATENGALTTDTVSYLSIVKPDTEATFITVTTEADKTLTLTPEHHVPAGVACCSSLKKAKDIAVGDVVWALEAGAVAPHTVVGVKLAIEMGLHSPVLTGGSFPIVEGFVTSFDSMEGVTLAKRWLNFMVALCRATGTCGLIRDAFLSSENKYIGEVAVLASPHATFEFAK